ncbi:fumarylacetoacetate hydrolase family protein [Massilia sp. TS11]|uniref:fumarylacetoacetate hydrolase family protein n=1 Tax=Massilia sp. TS11 TaxID=2908003 RepID=UPI001EDB0845|nr:fumarylacetoacetate hydrolase family protein [Massilia sp. TS11]MCG2586264.1 fumarylacetoacetate hydrolase family protein [Massilia sp. TS11]
MRLLRYGRPGKEKPGMLDDEGRIRDLSAILPDIDPSALAPKALRQLAKLDPRSLPLVRGTPRMGVPVKGVGKFIGIGLNYADHAAEMGSPIPSDPVIFLKATSCLSGADDPIMLPRGSKRTDWEVELGVVIGTRARYVEEKDALRHVAGYCVVNDLSEREFQKDRGPQWDKGKGCDTFGPVGPWLVTPDEIYDEQDLDLYLDLNGKRMQTGNTKTMIFSVATLIARVSTYMTLEPGDIIATGTPPGVGMGRKPQRYLKAGDQVRLGIPGLGEQQHEVVAFKL